MKRFVLNLLLAGPFFASAQVPSGYVAYYPLNNNASDETTNAYNGTLSNTSGATDRFGNAGAATAFTFGSSSGQLPGSLQTAIKSSFSFGFWFKSSMTASSHSQWYGGNPMFDAEVCGGTTDWGIAMINGGKIAFGVGNGADVTIISPLDYNDGNWHFVTAVRDATVATMRLYVDGNQVATASGPYTLDLVAPPYIGIANHPCSPAPRFEGSLDEVVVYDRTLNMTEAANLYNFTSFLTLPVTWKSFTALEKNDVIVLNWEVSQSGNTVAFEIETSKDGHSFTRSAVVPVTRNTRQYSYSQSYSASSKIMFFRIRQLEADGKFSYSKTIQMGTVASQHGLSIVNNPAYDVVTLRNHKLAAIQQILILDVSGRVVATNQTRGASAFIRTNISHLQAGQYFMSVKTASGTTVLKFVRH